MTSQYPNKLDTYTTKHNVVAGQEEYTGDYVEAEHVNDLQDAVANIESTLGTDPQGNNLSVQDRLNSIEDSKSLKTPSICIHLGNPLTFNGANTIEKAANEYLYYNHVVFGDGIESTSHPQHSAFIQLLSQLKASRDIRSYGYIDIASRYNNQAEVVYKIEQWYTLGVNGVFLDGFGYDSLVSRNMQNFIINAAHSLGLSTMINAPNDTDVFGKLSDSSYNPYGIEPVVDGRDIYLHDYFAVDTLDEDVYTDFDSLKLKAQRVTSARLNTGTKIIGLAHINSTVEDDTAQTLFNYAQAVAILYSYDGLYATTEGYGTDTNSQKLYKNLSLVGNYYDRSPQVINLEANKYYRIGSFGKINIDTQERTYTLEGIAVPGETIFGNINDVNFQGGKLDGVATELLVINSHKNTLMYETHYLSSLAPSNPLIPVSLHQEISDNGTLTYMLSWGAYVDGDIPADFILIYWKEGQNVGQPLCMDNCYALLPNLQEEQTYSFFNFISEKYYNFGVAAAKRVGNCIEVGQISSPDNWQNVTQGTPDFNWKLDGQLAEELKNVVYKVEIISTNGITFKNSDIYTILQARVYHGADDVTDTIDPNRFQWTRTSSDPEGDALWNFNNAGGYKEIEITNDDVFARASFTCTVRE